MKGNELIHISFGTEPAYYQTHFWNILYRNPQFFGASFHYADEKFVPRSVNIINHADVGPLPWGYDLSADKQIEGQEVVDMRYPLSEYHSMFYDKNSESYQTAYAAQMQHLLANWSDENYNAHINDARIRLQTVGKPTDYMEFQRELTKYTDFSRQHDDIMDQVRLQLEKCDNVSGFVLTDTSQQPLCDNQILLEFLNDNTPKQSILLFDAGVDSYFTPFKRSILQYTFNEYSSHGLFSSNPVNQPYNDSASLAVKLAELLGETEANKYSFDALATGLQLTPHLNLIDCQGILEKGLYQSQIRQLRQSFAHILLSGQQVHNSAGRSLCLGYREIELSETFPHLFGGPIQWRTSVSQEMALYNGKRNKVLVEPQLYLCGRFKEYYKHENLEDDDFEGAAEFIREQHRAYEYGL